MPAIPWPVGTGANVIGPGSSTSGNIVSWGNTDGTVLTDSGIAASDVSSLLAIKVYRALLTEGNPPTVDATLENGLSGPVVWTRESSGLYRGTLASAFAANKVYCSAILGGAPSDVTAGGCIVFAGRTSDNVVTVATFGQDGNYANYVGTLQIEILVYP